MCMYYLIGGGHDRGLHCGLGLRRHRRRHVEWVPERVVRVESRHELGKAGMQALPCGRPEVALLPGHQGTSTHVISESTSSKRESKRD
jgi:hypothetical protein